MVLVKVRDMVKCFPNGPGSNLVVFGVQKITVTVTDSFNFGVGYFYNISDVGFMEHSMHNTFK